MSPNPMLFGALLIVSLLVFGAGCYRRLSLVTLGEPEERLDNPGLRLRRLLVHVFGQRQVVTGRFGWNHAVIFWSFLVLMPANLEFMASGIIPGFTLEFLPAPLHDALLFAFDLASLLALAAVLVAFSRRLFFPHPSLSSNYVKARSAEGFLILSLIALLMVAYFGLHGATIAAGVEGHAAAMPVSGLVAGIVSASWSGSLASLALCFWWLHAAALFAFLCLLPASKHMHILTAVPNIFLASEQRPNTQPREEFVKGGRYGVDSVGQFSWKDLLDGFSCTECGRCQEACPAAATGKTLNPRQVIHAIKSNLLSNASSLQIGEPGPLPLIGAEGEGTGTRESIWACTTCGSCMNVCPVLIEHMPKIVKMRRHLVQMKSDFPEELLPFFENMEGRSNPWGMAPAERTKWHGPMEVRPFEEGRTEYLFYVGCAGAFDSRQKQATVALATILDAAGVSWGTLGKDEKCCGDSLRRLGNEFVFERMAIDNVQLFWERGVRKIVTQCPHCFSTLKNDYRQYGIELEVLHHSQLIAELLEQGRLRLNREAGDPGKLLFHDSCYLGRHNEVYSAPRRSLEMVTGKAPGEFPRSGRESFCCGAGGGRMWQEEHQGERINLNRVREALEQKPDTICVSCPYCMTMLEDGLKDLQAAGIRVRELAEVVAEGVMGQRSLGG